MGDNCSSCGNVETIDKHMFDGCYRSSPEFIEYQTKIYSQLIAFIESLPISPELKNTCKEILSKDCQGLTTSAAGDEVSALEDLVDQILKFQISVPVLINCGMNFIIALNDNIDKYDARFGRYKKVSGNFLIKKISKLKTEVLISTMNDNEDARKDFLFCIIGTFRYSSVTIFMNIIGS